MTDTDLNSKFSERVAPDDTENNGLDAAFLKKAALLDSEREDAEATEKDKKEALLSPFEATMQTLELSKDDIIDMAIQIAEKGFVEENVTILGGKIALVFTSGKMEDNRDFVDIFENLDARLQTTVDYKFNVYTVGLIVTKYNGESTGNTVKERGEFIEKNVPMPIFKKILTMVSSFGRKIELLSEDEASVFF